MFPDFTIPGLSLLFLVGGSALVATVLLLRRSRYGPFASGASGVIVMTFEFVDVLAIGSPPGPARTMQLVYFSIGLALAVLSLGATALAARRPS